MSHILWKSNLEMQFAFDFYIKYVLLFFSCTFKKYQISNKDLYMYKLLIFIYLYTHTSVHLHIYELHIIHINPFFLINC